MIHFTCERCHHLLAVDDRLAGMTGRCDKCGASITAPAASPTAFAADTDDVQMGAAFRRQIAPVEEDKEDPPKKAVSVARIGCGLLFAFFLFCVMSVIVTSSPGATTQSQSKATERVEYPDPDIAVKKMQENINISQQRSNTRIYSGFSFTAKRDEQLISLRAVVPQSFHSQPYQERLQCAQLLWEFWAKVACPTKPDYATISLVDFMGNEVGGSRVWGGSSIWVQEQ